jgi:ribosomal protein L40E
MAELKPITCAACGASSFEHDSKGNLICTHCGTQYASPRELILCPACGTENPAQALKCMKCGLNLGKLCPACNELNPPGAEHCLKCGTPLDTLASIAMRRGEGKRISDAMREQRLVSQKGQDVAYMEQQRRAIDAEEYARQQQLARQKAEAARQQRILIVVAVLIVICLIAGGVFLSMALKAQ